MLDQGDLIFHPSHGFGTISGLTRRDPLHPIQDVVAGEGVSDQAEDYYDIQLMDGGTLLVPVSRAERVGLRLLTNGVDAIAICLHSPAQSLPEDARKRAAELWARGRIGEPTAAGRLCSGYAGTESRSSSHGQRESVARQVLRASQQRSCAGRSHFPIAGTRCHLGSGEPTERRMILTYYDKRIKASPWGGPFCYTGASVSSDDRAGPSCYAASGDPDRAPAGCFRSPQAVLSHSTKLVRVKHGSLRIREGFARHHDGGGQANRQG